MGKRNLNLTIVFISIFVLALILRVWFNFFDIHANAAFAFDAAEYLRYAQDIDLTFSRLFNEPFSSLCLCCKTLFGYASFDEIKQVKNIFEPLRSMSISGPVFPTFIFVCCKLFGKAPSVDCWMIPITIQCILTSLVPALIAAIGVNCWNKKTGIIAGILAAIYPGFIISSGRLYSESFACFLISLILWLITAYLIKDRNDIKSGFLLGVMLFALQMTRSIMVVLTLGIFAFFIVSCFLLADRRVQIIKYLLAVIAGLAFCLLPWLAVQKLITGRASIVVDRVSNYNLLVGNDVDGLGWLSIPYQDCSKTDKENYLHIMKISISRSPERWFKLMLDKPARLFKLPWNDFKTSIGIISPFMQTIFHQVILALAAIGLIFSNIKLKEEDECQKNMGRSVILFVFLIHLIYLFFITLPRYALTAVPEVLLFAGAGLTIILEAFRSRDSIGKAIRLIAAIVLLMLFSTLNIIGTIVPFDNTDFMLTRVALIISIAFKLIVACLFFYACWQMFMQLRRSNNNQASYGIPLLISILLFVFALPAYCLPLRAHGRWYEWSLPFNKSGQKIERVIIVDKGLADKLVEQGAYLAINLEGGTNFSTSTELKVNNVQLDSPMIPAMAAFQNLNLVNLNNNNQLSMEQEFIFQCLGNVSSVDLLDLRQWFLIPVRGDQWRNIINDSSAERGKADGRRGIADQRQIKENVILRITLCKKDDTNTIVYGAYPTDALYSFMPSVKRFSWEKAFYSVESESGFNDPFYDEKIVYSEKVGRNSFEEKVRLQSQSPGLFLKLLVPKTNQVVERKEGASVGKDATVSNSFLRVTDEQYKTGNSYSQCLLSFLPKTKTDRKEENNFCLIRLRGEIDGETNREINGDDRKDLPIARVHFSRVISKSNKQEKNKQADLIYQPVWVPKEGERNLSLKDLPLRFDYCFPMLLNAFPGGIDRIELMSTVDKNRANDEIRNINLAQKEKHIHAQCLLQIYQSPDLSALGDYEIF